MASLADRIKRNMGCLGGNSADAQNKEQRERSKEIEKQLMKDKAKYKATHRLLLLGECGKVPGSQADALNINYGNV